MCCPVRACRPWGNRWKRAHRGSVKLAAAVIEQHDAVDAAVTGAGVVECLNRTTTLTCPAARLDQAKSSKKVKGWGRTRCSEKVLADGAKEAAIQ